MKAAVKIHPMDELHEKAMELADMAYSAERKGNTENLQQWYLEAFEYEKAAAMLLVNDYDMEPTHSVYFRSAASLIYSLPEISFEQFREAERMVAFGLSGKPPVIIADELRDVLEHLKIKFYAQHKEGEHFEQAGRFTAVNLKIKQFEFLSSDNQSIKGSFAEQISEQLQQIAFSMKYKISGWLSLNGGEQYGFVDRIILE